MFSNSTFESRALRLFLADCVVGKVAKCDLNPEVNFTFITSTTTQKVTIIKTIK